MKTLILFISLAHAGWWSDFCEKHLIADDPYQYEEVSHEWLLRRIESLELHEKFGQLSKTDRRILKVLQGELRRRQR